MARHAGRNWALLERNAPHALITYQNPIMAQKREVSPPIAFSFFSVEETTSGNKKSNE
jgi:hypothetical protein